MFFRGVPTDPRTLTLTLTLTDRLGVARCAAQGRRRHPLAPGMHRSPPTAETWPNPSSSPNPSPNPNPTPTPTPTPNPNPNPNPNPYP